jgi:23S rRNA pseudouridine1911/1915/1917 synthase
LDQLTSGLVLIGKNRWAHQQLAIQLGSGEISRLYLAFCNGRVKNYSGKINAPIEEQPDSALRTIGAGGKQALTRYRVVQRADSATLLAVKIFTGRTHQIRVHFSHLGYPLIGDPLYGSAEENLARTALHAVCLSFTHPRFKKRIRIKTALPADLKKLALKLGLFT